MPNLWFVLMLTNAKCSWQTFCIRFLTSNATHSILYNSESFQV